MCSFSRYALHCNCQYIIMCVHVYFTGTLYTVVASIIGGLASAVVLYQLYSRIQIFVTIMRTVR